MRILIGVDGSSQGLNGARLVATLPLSPSDQVIVPSAVHRSALLGVWGYAPTDLTGKLYGEAWSVAQANAHEATAEAAAVLATLPCVVRKVLREGHRAAVLPTLVRKLDDRAESFMLRGPGSTWSNGGSGLRAAAALEVTAAGADDQQQPASDEPPEVGDSRGRWRERALEVEQEPWRAVQGSG